MVDPKIQKNVKHIPNSLTVARLFLTLMFLGLILYAPHTGKEKPAGLLMVAFGLFVIAGITDIVDGHIARRFEVTSKFGRIVDPLADKILVCGSYFCFAIVGKPIFEKLGLSSFFIAAVHWTTAILIFAREIIVQTMRSIAESRGINFGAIASGKIKMFLQSFGIGTVIIGWAFVSGAWGDWFTIIVYICTIGVTIYSGLESFKRPIH